MHTGDGAIAWFVVELLRGPSEPRDGRRHRLQRLPNSYHRLIGPIGLAASAHRCDEFVRRRPLFAPLRSFLSDRRARSGAAPASGAHHPAILAPTLLPEVNRWIEG
jgi:hypothetical protein